MLNNIFNWVIKMWLDYYFFIVFIVIGVVMWVVILGSGVVGVVSVWYLN